MLIGFLTDSFGFPTDGLADLRPASDRMGAARKGSIQWPPHHLFARMAGEELRTLAPFGDPSAEVRQHDPRTTHAVDERTKPTLARCDGITRIL